MSELHTRRGFLLATGAGAAASLAATGTSPVFAAAGGKRPARIKLGMTSYTTRKLSLDETITIVKRLDLRYLSLKSFHLPLNSTAQQCAQVAAKIKAAGITLYGCGVVGMKNETQINQAFDYAKAAGMTTIIAAPTRETLPLIDKKVKAYNIKVAIHNHGPGDKNFPTPQSAYEAVKNFDRRIGLCIDIGHTVRAGADPSRSAEEYADRLYDIHMKDVSAAAPQGRTVEMGRGVIDIPRFLRTLIKIKYSGVASFEYEKDSNDPLPGLAESVGYVRGVLAVI